MKVMSEFKNAWRSSRRSVKNERLRRRRSDCRVVSLRTKMPSRSRKRMPRRRREGAVATERVNPEAKKRTGKVAAAETKRKGAGVEARTARKAEASPGGVSPVKRASLGEDRGSAANLRAKAVERNDRAAEAQAATKVRLKTASAAEARAGSVAGARVASEVIRSAEVAVEAVAPRRETRRRNHAAAVGASDVRAEAEGGSLEAMIQLFGIVYRPLMWT